MKYMIINSTENFEFTNNFDDALKKALGMANFAAVQGRDDVVLLKDIDRGSLILRLYAGGGEVCTFFSAPDCPNEYFPECEFDCRYAAPVSYLYDRYKMSREFCEKYYAMKDGKVVVVTSDIYELKDELRDGHIPLPVSVMHIRNDGIVENYKLRASSNKD